MEDRAERETSLLEYGEVAEGDDRSDLSLVGDERDPPDCTLYGKSYSYSRYQPIAGNSTHRMQSIADQWLYIHSLH